METVPLDTCIHRFRSKKGASVSEEFALLLGKSYLKECRCSQSLRIVHNNDISILQSLNILNSVNSVFAICKIVILFSILVLYVNVLLFVHLYSLRTSMAYVLKETYLIYDLRMTIRNST